MTTHLELVHDTTRAQCEGVRVGKRKGTRCTAPALRGSDYCARHHSWPAGSRGQAPIKMRDGLISLDALWYRADRVVSFIERNLEPIEQQWLLTAGSNPSWVNRRWYAIRHEYEWVTCAMADKLLSHCGLHLHELGDPDVASSLSPDDAIASGYVVTPYNETSDVEAMNRAA